MLVAVIHVRLKTSPTAMGLTSSLDLGNAIRGTAHNNVEIDFGICPRAKQDQAACR